MSGRGRRAGFRIDILSPMVRFAAGIAALIAVTAALGAVQLATGAPAAFNLDAELRVPAFVSAALLLIAAWTAWGVGPAWPWRVLAALFALMALDELLELHERLEAATGIDWQRLYLPVMLGAGAAWLVALSRMRNTPAAAAWLVAGALAWVTAGALEFLQWNGLGMVERRVDGYLTLMGLEETLEMCGSAAFALGHLRARDMFAAWRE